MRNLKRALSLALASVMLLGMMVVGTSAASYPDVKDSDNVEAIEVLNAVGVMIGKKGKFDPDAPVNRHEMAAIMARLVLGEDAETYVGNHPFTDVYPWADKYVAACYENGIINGTSKTTFSGNQPLTAIQAATMMLRALGYEYLTKGASDWRVPVAAQANKIGLFRGVTSSPSAQLTRNQVAQLALNTLESDVVEFTGTLGWEINGITVGDQLKWDPKADFSNNDGSGKTYNYALDDVPAKGEAGTHQYQYIQLCEELYDGQLLKDSTENDEFGRPAVKWIYKGQEVVAANKGTVATFTNKVKEKDIFKAMGVSGINGTYSRYIVMDKIYENGVLVGKSAGFTSGDVQTTDPDQIAYYAADPSVGGAMYQGNVIIAKDDGTRIGYSDNGYSIEIYESDKANHYVMVIVKSTVAKVTNIVTAKDKTTYTMDNGVGSYIDYADEKDDDKIVLHGDVSKGDYVTCAVIKNVAHVWPTTKISGAQTAINSDNEITVGGEKYTIGTGVAGVNKADYVNSTKEANYYIDRLGYVVKTDSTASTDYAYIVDVYAKADKSIDGTDLSVQVRAVLADGTVGVYDVQVEKNSGKTHWVLKDTSYNLETVANVNANPAVVSAVDTALDDKTFGYTLDGSKISLEVLNTLPNSGSNTTNDTVYSASLGNVVKKDKTSYTVNTDKSVLADKDTAFVIYNADKKTTTIYTGAANLPKSIDDENTNAGGTGYAVLRTGTTNKVGTASVVFVNTATGITAEATDDYVYIDATKWTETKDGSTTKYVYNYTRPDGTTGTTAAGDRIGTGVKGDSGVYVLKSDNTVDKNRPTKTQYVNSAYSNLLTIDGNNSNLIQANGQWYNIDEAQIVYIDDSIGNLDANDGYVVLKVKDGTVTNTVETIFVVKAGDGADAPAPSSDAALKNLTGVFADDNSGGADVATPTVTSTYTGTTGTVNVTFGAVTGTLENNDTITITATDANLNDSNAALDAGNKMITFTYSSGSWTATGSIKVTAEDGTVVTYSGGTCKSRDARLDTTSVAGAEGTVTGTYTDGQRGSAVASAATVGGTTTYKVTITKPAGGSSQANDTITYTMVNGYKSSITAVITIKYEGGDWVISNPAVDNGKHNLTVKADTDVRGDDLVYEVVIQ